MRFLAAFATALLLAPFGTLISYPFLLSGQESLGLGACFVGALLVGALFFHRVYRGFWLPGRGKQAKELIR